MNNLSTKEQYFYGPAIPLFNSGNWNPALHPRNSIGEFIYTDGGMHGRSPSAKPKWGSNWGVPGTRMKVLLHQRGTRLDVQIDGKSSSSKNVYWRQFVSKNGGSFQLDGPGELSYGNGKPPYQFIAPGAGFSSLGDQPGFAIPFPWHPSMKLDFKDYLIDSDTGAVLGQVNWGMSYSGGLSGTYSSYGAGTFTY